MNWHRRCRLCLAETPMRPVHALQTPKLLKLLKDLCQIQIDINDNMDLVCTNCVQVISSLKFFISNQKVIEECRDFQKMLMVIKEENESSDCVIVDLAEDAYGNKNQPEENMKIDVNHKSASTINKSTLTESILSTNDLKSTSKRISSDDHSKIEVASDDDTLDNEICSNTEINTTANAHGNTNEPEENMKIDVNHESASTINKSTLTESNNTTKRRSSDDHSKLVLASDEVTLDNEVCSNTEINTTTESCDNHPPKLKKCKIILSRIKNVKGNNCSPCPKNKQKTKNYAEPLKHKNECNPDLKTSTKESETNGNLNPKMIPSKSDTIVTKNSTGKYSSSPVIIAKQKKYIAENVIASAYPAVTLTQNNTLSTKENSQIISSESIKMPSKIGIECTWTPINHADQRKLTTTTLPQTELYLPSNKEENIKKSLNLPSNWACTIRDLTHKTPDSSKPSNISSKISGLLHPINITKDEIPKANIKKQVTSMNEKPATELNINKNESPKTSVQLAANIQLANSFASISTHNMNSHTNDMSTSKGQTNFITSLHNKSANDLQSKNCSMKILTVNEFNKISLIKQPQSKKVIGVVHPNNTDSTVELSLRIIRHGSNFGIRIQHYGSTVAYSNLTAKQLPQIKRSIETIFKTNKNMQLLFLMCSPDEETKTLLNFLQIEHYYKSVTNSN